MPNRTTSPGTLVARHAETQVRAALDDTRIVAIVGPRQSSGKTTLAGRIAGDDGRPFITLDDEQFRRFAEDDPAGFVHSQPVAVIIAAVDKRVEMSRLIDHTAAASGRLLNMSALGLRLGIDSKTVDRWLALLEQMFLVRRVRAWHRNRLKRLVKTPKLHFLDSGLLAALRGTDAADIAKDREKFGPLLECFVHAEIAKAAALSDETTTVGHYRDKDRLEIDLVLERSPDRVVGIEVKAEATARPEDFKGLVRLEKAAGDRFACGIVLHDGDRVQRTGSRLFAMPVKMLWTA